MITYHQIDNRAVYIQDRLARLTRDEANRPDAYYDSRGFASIGIGFNIHDPAVRPRVTLAFGINPANTALNAAGRAREQMYLDEIARIVGPLRADTAANNQALQTALDNVMARRAADPLLQGLQNRELDFRFDGVNDPRIVQVFNDLAELAEGLVR